MALLTPNNCAVIFCVSKRNIAENESGILTHQAMRKMKVIMATRIVLLNNSGELINGVLGDAQEGGLVVEEVRWEKQLSHPHAFFLLPFGSLH